MPAHCCAFGCKSRQTAGVNLKFFRIPKDEHLRAKWVSAIKREDWEPSDHFRICSKHFISGQPSREPTKAALYMPSIFCHRPIHDGVLQEKVQRHRRLVERMENKARNESAQALLTLSKEEPPVCLMGTSTQTLVVPNSDTEVQTDITLPVMTSLINTNQYLKGACDANAASIRELKQNQQKLQDICHEQEEELKSLKAKLKHQEEENNQLMEEINKKTLSFKNIQDDDRKTKFYTGFPNFNTRNAVFKETSSKVNRKRTKLPKEDELLLLCALARDRCVPVT